MGSSVGCGRRCGGQHPDDSHKHLAPQGFHDSPNTLRQGFQKRQGSGKTSSGHDVPVVVRESSTSELGAESLSKWARQLRGQPGLPPLRVQGDRAVSVHVGSSGKHATGRAFREGPKAEFFTSLGNGHFFQARAARVGGARRAPTLRT